MDPRALTAALCIFAAIVLGLWAIYSATASPRSNLERRLGTLIGDSLPYESTPSSFEGLRQRRAGNVPVLSSLLQSRGGTEELALDLERADLNLTVSEYVASRLFMGVLLGIVPLVVLGLQPLGLLAIGVAMAVGFMLPKLYLNFRKKRRLQKLSDQLPEMLSMLANALKSGFGLLQSMDLVARELSHPIATDIRRMLQEVNVGSRTEDALQNMARRSGNADLDIVITAMLIQQSTGGNLAEILENVGHTMRERIRIRGEIKTLTTQQVMTGFIIGGLPVFLGVVITMLNPDYMSLLYTRLAGQAMLAGAVVMELFGIFLIKRILAIEV